MNRYLNLTGVTCIGHIDIFLSDQADVGRTTSLALLIILGTILLPLHLILNLGDFGLALRSEHHLIHPQENLLESYLIIFLDEVLIAFKLMSKMPTDEGCNFGSFFRE